MFTLQPLIEPASTLAYLFSIRGNEKLAFSVLESDIKEELSELFSDKWEIVDDPMRNASNLIFIKENLDTFTKMVVLIVKYKRLGKMLLHYFDNAEKAKHALEEAYIGDFMNKLMFTYRYVEKLGPIPEPLDVYIDYPRLAEDLFMNEFYAVEVGDRTHVFKRES